MKEFKNLHEAFGHRALCPFCKQKMGISYVKLDVSEDKEKVTLVTGSTSFIIDCMSNAIYQMSDPSVLNGLFIFSVMVICNDCLKYSHILQVHADIGKMEVAKVVLNSESISIEEEARLYEIKNIFVAEKTEMSTFYAQTSHQRGPINKVQLPLVPMDFENPMKTVERIKGLLVFL